METSELSDDLNPELLFSLTYNQLLIDILSGKIDPVKLAKKELKNRGFDKDGKWVGFKK